MAKKSKVKPKKAKSTVKAGGGLSNIVKKGASVVSGLSGGGSSKKGGRRKRKRSIAWYSNEIMRLKLKKRYNKIRYSGGM